MRGLRQCVRGGVRAGGEKAAVGRVVSFCGRSRWRVSEAGAVFGAEMALAGLAAVRVIGARAGGGWMLKKKKRKARGGYCIPLRVFGMSTRRGCVSVRGWVSVRR